MTTENRFFYNKGWEHRGVWHLAKDLTVVTVLESKRGPEDFEAIDWKGETAEPNFDPTVEYYVPDHQYPSSRKPHKVGYPILGRSRATIVTPEHRVFSAEAACGAGTFKGDNTVDNWNSIHKLATSKKSIGKDLGELYRDRIVELLVRYGGTPPEPFCKHCLRLIEKEAAQQAYQLDVREPEDLRDEEQYA